MVLAVFALALASQKESAIEPLYELPARFSQGCPIVSLNLSSELHGVEKDEFLLDSGASRSILLDLPGAGGIKPEAGRRSIFLPGPNSVLIGSLGFAAPGSTQFNPKFLEKLGALGIRGVLGMDFLRGHDVLVDYVSQRVFVSQSRMPHATRWELIGASRRQKRENGPLNQIRFLGAGASAPISLVRKGNAEYIDASNSASSDHWLMRLDTWATRSTVPVSVARSWDRTGAKEDVETADRSVAGDQVQAWISIAPNVDLEVKPDATDRIPPTLGSDAFQTYTLLIQGGDSVLRLWPQSVLNAFVGPVPAQPLHRN